MVVIDGTTGRTPEPDALARLVDYYCRANLRMQGLPVHNPALAVEGVGFRGHLGRQVGVIVTPWFMNLAVLPAAEDLAAWRNGTSARLLLPSGRYDFVGDAGDNGLVATCSLFSPMHDFTGQEDARLAAHAAVEALFEPQAPERSRGPGPAPMVSRRKFLGG